jgi:hypothetical protein
MPNRIAAGCLLILFFGFHTDKLLSYLGCRLSNISNNTTKCDCEKQVNDGPAPDQQPYSQKEISGERTDEFFLSFPGVLTPGAYSLTDQKPWASQSNSIPRAGFIASIFRPPDLD